MSTNQTRVPMSVEASTSQSSSGENKEAFKLAVGPDNANVYIEAEHSQNKDKERVGVAIGAEAKIINLPSFELSIFGSGKVTTTIPD